MGSRRLRSQPGSGGFECNRDVSPIMHSPMIFANIACAATNRATIRRHKTRRLQPLRGSRQKGVVRGALFHSPTM